MNLRSALAPSFVVLLVACGGTTTGSAPGSDGGSHDASTLDASGGDAQATTDGGCVSEPAAGSACRETQVACATGDRCCLGYAWTCDPTTRSWQKLGLGCACILDAGTDAAKRDAGPAVCGATTCGTNEYCVHSSGGAQPPDGGSNARDTCAPIPAACVADPSCACLQANGRVCSCAEVDGHPVDTCNYP
jgi:hypothetical protein